MDTTTLITIIILVVLTLVIFAFALLAFYQSYKSEKVLILNGSKDQDIAKDKTKQKRSNKVLSLLSSVFSGLICVAAIGLLAFSLVVKNSGSMIFMNGNTSLVIASNSMSTYGNDDQLSENGGYLTPSMVQEAFVRGDVLQLTSIPSYDEMLSKNEKGEHYIVKNGSQFPSTYASDYLNKTFAFTYSNETIVHRLVNITINNPNTENEKVYFTFQGDKYPGNTQLVQYDRLKALYDGHSKTQMVGYFILFFSSSFGLYSVFSSIAMVIASSIFLTKIDKEYKSRWKVISPSYNEDGTLMGPNLEEKKEEILEARVEDQSIKPENQESSTIIIDGKKVSERKLTQKKTKK
jgi:hypothetical protein